MKYANWQAPLLTFFDGSFYRQRAKYGRGTGFLYLFCLLLFCYPLSLAGGYLHFVLGLESTQINEIAAKLPDLTFRQGILTINKPCPYKMEFKNASSGENTLIV